MIEVHPGLLRLDYVQYLIKTHTVASPRSFRSFTLADREHRFKNWSTPKNLGKLSYCLNCGTEHSTENPITADHMIPQVLTKYPDPIRSQLKNEVVGDSKNLFSVCQVCHNEIDRYKISTLGVDLPQNPAGLFEFLAAHYPITTGRNRLRMLESAKNVIDKYIDVVEGYVNNHNIRPDTSIQAFIDSLPMAYEFSGFLYREQIRIQSELDASCGDLVQSSS